MMATLQRTPSVAKSIDWLYFRKSCATCQKAQGFLGPAGITAKETVNAIKERIDGEAALKLLAGIDKIVAMKGKKIERIDLKKNRPDDDTILSHIIGPTGNLRAPTARVGKTLLVGFSEEAYQEIFG